MNEEKLQRMKETVEILRKGEYAAAQLMTEHVGAPSTRYDPRASKKVPLAVEVDLTNPAVARNLDLAWDAAERYRGYHDLYLAATDVEKIPLRLLEVMHLCRFKGWDFETLLSRARESFDENVAEEKEPAS